MCDRAKVAPTLKWITINIAETDGLWEHGGDVSHYESFLLDLILQPLTSATILSAVDLI
jgi:hypothetical protein